MDYTNLLIRYVFGVGECILYIYFRFCISFFINNDFCWGSHTLVVRFFMRFSLIFKIIYYDLTLFQKEETFQTVGYSVDKIQSTTLWNQKYKNNQTESMVSTKNHYYAFTFITFCTLLTFYLAANWNTDYWISVHAFQFYFIMQYEKHVR